MTRTALVTGATGWLGSHLAAHLLEDGWEVRATDSSRAPSERLPGGVSWIPSGPEMPASLVEAMAGVDTVFHAHALCRGGTPWERLYRTNVLGTENLLLAARRAGVRRVVVFSSFAVYGQGCSGRFELDETCRIRPRCPYGRSRAIQDALVWRYHEGGLPITILRPGLLYGGRDGSALGACVRFLARLPAVPVPINIRSRVLSVHVQDLVRAASFAASKDECAGQEYHIVDQGCLATSAFVTLLALALGRKTVPVFFPLTVLRAAARLADSGFMISGRLAQSFPFLQPETFSCLAIRSRASSRKIQSLGFSLIHPDPTQGLPPWVHEIVKAGTP